MSTLLDTNILTCLSLQMHPHHVAAKSAITVLRNQGETLHVVPQNLYEFWAVATRPVIASNGFRLASGEYPGVRQFVQQHVQPLARGHRPGQKNLAFGLAAQPRHRPPFKRQIPGGNPQTVRP